MNFMAKTIKPISVPGAQSRATGQIPAHQFRMASRDYVKVQRKAKRDKKTVSEVIRELLMDYIAT